MSRFRVSMDIGGTFTDVVAYDEDDGAYAAGKAETTPADLTEGVLAALDQVVWGKETRFRLPAGGSGRSVAPRRCG